MKFDKNGKFIKILASKGEGPGQVMEPGVHLIICKSRRRGGADFAALYDAGKVRAPQP
jgi:hypothetical protein